MPPSLVASNYVVGSVNEPVVRVGLPIKLSFASSMHSLQMRVRVGPSIMKLTVDWQALQKLHWSVVLTNCWCRTKSLADRMQRSQMYFGRALGVSYS
jgi:hypothetical protein